MIVVIFLYLLSINKRSDNFDLQPLRDSIRTLSKKLDLLQLDADTLKNVSRETLKKVDSLSLKANTHTEMLRRIDQATRGKVYKITLF